MPAYPAGWDPVEEARAAAYRAEQRARYAAERAREFGVRGNAVRRLTLANQYLAITWRTRDERDPDDPEWITVNG